MDKRTKYPIPGHPLKWPPVARVSITNWASITSYWPL